MTRRIDHHGSPDAKDRKTGPKFRPPQPKWYTPTPADADLVDPPLDMTLHKTEHVCNLYNVNCRDQNCPCLRAPEGTCRMFLREGWCQRATHYAQNRMLPLKPGQPPLTDCDRPLHVVLHIDEGGMSWHPVAAYEKPLPSTGITPECADVIGGVKSKAKKQMSDGQEQMETGRFAARVPLLAMREVKGELAQDTLDGNQVSYGPWPRKLGSTCSPTTTGTPCSRLGSETQRRPLRRCERFGPNRGRLFFRGRR